MEFKAGDIIMIKDEYVDLPIYRLCSKGTQYKVVKLYSSFGIMGDTGHAIILTHGIKHHFKLVSEKFTHTMNRGDDFTITDEGLKTQTFSDCSKRTVYRVQYLTNDGFGFLDDNSDRILVTRDTMKYIYFLDESVATTVEPIGKQLNTPEFKGFHTAKDFEQLIDYALATGDDVLFNECTEEMKRLNILEGFGSR